MFATYLLFTEYKILSVFLLYLHIVLDYSDGWIARYNESVSKFSQILDPMNHIVVTVSMIIVSSIISGYTLITIFTIFLYLLMFLIPYYKTELLIGEINSPIRQFGGLINEFMIYFGIFVNRLEIIIFARVFFSGIMFTLFIFSKIQGLRNNE